MMPPKNPKPSAKIPTKNSLRKRAEEMLRKSRAEVSAMSADDVQALVHELQVQQIELEIQNEELRQTQVKLSDSPDRYSGLYNFSPIGHPSIDISKEKEAGEWKIQAERLRQMVENLPAGAVFIADSRLTMNRAAEEITGYSRDELDTRDRWFKALYPGKIKEARELYEQNRQAGFRESIINTIRHSDGGERVIRFAAHGFEGHEVWFLNDFTEQRNVEKALYERNERYRAILNAAVDAIVTIDRRGLIEDVNPAVEKMFGYSHDQIIGESVNILIPLPDKEKHDQNLKNYQQSGRAQIIGLGREVIARHKDGTLFPVEILVSELDHLGLFTGIIRDITVRKAAELALRNQYHFNDAIITTARTIILVLDQKGRIVSFNPYFETITGWKLEDCVGFNWFDLCLPEQTRKEARKKFTQKNKEPSPTGSIYSMLTKKGGECTIEWFEALLKNAEDHVNGFLLTGTDITEKRKLEVLVVRATEEERRRTAGELHDGVASLLAGIDYRAQALIRELQQADDVYAQDVRIISQHIRDAISQVRTISQGLYPIGPHPENLVDSLWKLTKQIKSTTGITCQFRCRSDFKLTEVASANHLFRIAQEAANNALKHSGCSHITLSLKPNKNKLILSILDNGCGYEEALAKKGGIGLHTMGYRARSMRGILTVRKRDKGGTEVMCSIPLE